VSRDASILDRLFRVTRGELDNATAPIPTLGQIIPTFDWWEVSRVSAFWRDRSEAVHLSFEEGCQDLTMGLAHLGAPCAYWVRGTPTTIAVRFGAPRTAAAALEALHGLLAASYPDIRVYRTLDVDRMGESALLGHAVQLTGIPAEKAHLQNGVACEQIEKLCRAMYGARWSYFVHAQPVARAEVVAALNQILGEIRSVQGTVMLKGTVDEENRLAKLYIEILEAQAKRYEAARGAGLWNAQAFLMTDRGSWLARARAAMMNAFAGERSYPVPLRVLPCDGRVSCAAPACEPLTSRELSILLQIPRESYPGYEVVEPARFSLRAPSPVQAGRPRIQLGEILDRGQLTGNQFDVPLADVAKHVLISGVTGSGKTNTAFRLLESLWVEHQVPFLVIESAKSEYRELLANPAFGQMQVYTLGDETVAPFRLNPFEVPDGILVQTHIDYVKALFAASFVLYPPMPYVLEQSLQEVFEDRGWDLAANTNLRGGDRDRAFPTLTDLHRKVEMIVRRMGYDQRLTMDVTAGLQARINQLRIGGGKGRMLDTRRSLPLDDILRKPCLLELKQVVSDDEKAFVIGLILIRLLEYLERSRTTRPAIGLRHVMFIEEAHRLLRNVSEQSGEDTANPRGRGVEVFANILAEVRAFGEGIVILEQIPSKLAPDAIKNTNLKIVHRIVAKDDREVLGAAMRAEPQQIAYFGVLLAGEAVVFAEGMNTPALMSVPLAAAKHAGASAIDDARLREAWRSSFDPAVYRRSTWCTHCPSLSSSSPCRADAGVWLGPGRSAFEAFHSALAHNRAFLRQAFADVEQACHGSRSAGRGSRDAVCSLNAFLEDAIEERSRFAGWQFSAVAELAEAAAATIRALVEQLDAADARAADRVTAKVAARYGRLYERLSKTRSIPFAACRLCDRQCEFRYEGSDEVRNGAAGEYFHDEFMESAGDRKRLALVAWGVTKGYVYPKDVTTRRCLALCFACQQAAALGLSSRNQVSLVEGIARELQTLAEEEHGKIAE
jgi:DNA helicase HerA-like ATPase